MSERDFNKLMTRFKELSDNPELEYQQEDWSAVEKMLDEQGKDRSIFWILSGLLVMSAVALWFFMFNGTSADSIKSINSANTSPSEQVSDPIISDNQIIDRHSGTAANMGQEITEREAVVSGETPEKHVKTSEGPITVQRPKESQLKIDEGSVTELAKDPSYDIHTNLTVLEDASYDDHDASGIVQSVVQTQSENRTINPELTRDESNVFQGVQGSNDQIDSDAGQYDNSRQLVDERATITSGYHLNSSLSTTGEVEEDNPLISKLPALGIAPLDLERINYEADMTFEKRSEKLEEKGPKILIGANAGIELAQSPLGGLSDTDYSIGLRFGYIASSKLVINAGVNYISECYQAEGDDYIPPVGFWASTEGVAPEEILALCDMIDVSLGASYHFSDVQSNGLSAHINLLSNFMLREEYDYRFAESSDDFTGLFTGENQTLLSQIELSTTYKLRTGGGYFIDAGPYLKLPLNGVGHGNVRLTSIGFRLGVSLVK